MPKLTVVPADARKPEKAQTVKQAAAGSSRDLLVALRDRIAADIDKGVPAHALAPLSRQLRDIAKEIEAIDAHDDQDEIGEAASTPDEVFATS